MKLDKNNFSITCIILNETSEAYAHLGFSNDLHSKVPLQLLS